ncbi:hypothetical protein CgunFtcFv8_003125 [Champsocephalus gunnari]|uniref:Ubiquitin interaction motif-containing protein 1 n=1 Tax=Champsocephalus gunnari TaxID=52237 RepID=A0AAN8HK62_CHAGU|nr:hypothetical protein CgunFtcFv8_003125 [Champsocephalus gunnari]
MALRKQILKDTSDIPCGSQQVDNNSQEEDDDDEDNNEELSSSLLSSSTRKKTKIERENKSKQEMTEEEMMDLALRLSEQEASVTALRQQQEEEAMMKAIQESIVSQTQPSPVSQSQSLLDDAEASPGVCSRRKLLYSGGKTASAIDQGASADIRTAETELNQGAKGTGGERNILRKKLKRKEGSPLLEMPDLSQSQKISAQDSHGSSDCLSAPLGSPQSSDSTQIEDCQPPKSPVFPSPGCRAKVLVPRLSQDLLQTCRSSGFVLCSQDTLTSPRKSPTFPKSPKLSSKLSIKLPLCRSPLFSDLDEGDDGEYFKSPVFGWNTQNKTSASACKPQDCKSGFSSQDSLTPSVRSTSCPPKSPVFPRCPGLPNNPHSSERSATCRSPVSSESDGGQAEQSQGFCKSPVFGRTGQREHMNVDVQTHSSGSGSEGNSTPTRDSSQSLDSNPDQNPNLRLNMAFQSDNAEHEICKEGNSAESALTSDMVLLWSGEDDDVTPTGSHSPVFPEERPLHQAESETAPPNHLTAASPGTNSRPSTSPTSSGRQQLVATERRLQPISSEPAEGPTVSYYWGVPFCPRGLDPDKYTQVIMAQMEVYEKSLKQAQRFLLRKAEWGGAVLPQPEKSPSPESAPESPPQLVQRRSGLRLKGKKVFEEDDFCPAEAEEADEEKQEEEGESKEEEKQEKKAKKAEEGGHVDTDEDCEVCPETQLSGNDDDSTQDLMMGTSAGVASECKISPERPEVEVILQVDSPAEAERQEEMEVEAPVDKKTIVPVSSSDVGGRHEKRTEELDPDVEEIKYRVLQRSSSPELEPEDRVDCPICQSSFPLTQIERHAAYCDGEEGARKPEKDCFQVSLKPRRKRPRLAEASSAETGEPSNTSIKIQEKCYICQKAVPLRDYSRHTELCIQRQSSNCQSNAAKGNLLSALEKTESRDSEAVPSGSKLPQREVIDLRDDDDEEEEGDSVSVLRISNSPIRSFTPISEATGCLIDFKKQYRGKKPRQRRK